MLTLQKSLGVLFITSLGIIIEEPTKLVILIYPNSREKRQAIQDIINLYLQRREGSRYSDERSETLTGG